MQNINLLSDQVSTRITKYLSAGGLFNPEQMEHEKVRDLLMDCRTHLDRLAQENARLNESLNRWIKAAEVQSEMVKTSRTETQVFRAGLCEVIRICETESGNPNADKIISECRNVLAATDSPEPTQSKEQKIITILTEAMANIANSRPITSSWKDLIDRANDALQRADKAGKGESTP